MKSIKEQIKEEEQKRTIVKGLCAILEETLDDMEKTPGINLESSHETEKYLDIKKVAKRYLSEQEMERYQGRYRELMERNVRRGKNKFRISP
ncbi:MAG: hypothetical protein U1B79_00210 [Candidatus Pacearchaeota archaeon]|nr:hypothetical protein [Nanoarchaeota archaeon]MDZ4226519.1 hypothetical protein [Candidatus Pacearchaeota archaeon]